jgi:uncharacterized YccA/Bax inhibitor family protein
MMRTANPALNNKTFAQFASQAADDTAMTIQGTVNKTGFLLLLLVGAASLTWSTDVTSWGGGGIGGLAVGGAIGGFIFAMITIFKKTWAPVTAPIYAFLEGLFLGALSSTLEMRFPGIVIQAVALTFGTLFALLMAYKSGLIKATENFKLGIVAATGGIALVYLATIVLGFFGINIPYIHGSGTIGIGFSVFVVVIAALNLVLDFDFIENGAEYGAPKYMEWYASFGLIVTLVWLYIEILRLLSKLSSRR